MLKNRAKKTKKILKNDSQMGAQKWHNFGGNSFWRTFGGPNRFCDQKINPQRSQSASNDRKMNQKLHKRAPRVRKLTPKVDPFRSHAKMSSKSGPFSDPGPADCAKRLQSARPLCLQRGAWGVLDRKLESCLSLTRLKVSLVAPHNPLYPLSYKFSKIYHILRPTSSKNEA